MSSKQERMELACFKKSGVAWALSALMLSTSLLSGCTTTKALSDDELDKAAKDRLALFEKRREQSGLDKPLSLAGALALAMDNNLDLRTVALEKAVAGYNRKLATVSMLPAITAQAGYSWRDSYAASSSVDVLTGTQSLVPSYSAERTGTVSSLGVSWNVLDFGLAWLAARSEGDKQHLAEETRRRVAAQVALDVVYAWDKSLAYQRIAPRLTDTRQDVLIALRDNERVLMSGYGDPVANYEYRSALLLMLKRMDMMALQMNQANDELARLLGLPAGQPLQLDAASALSLTDLPDADIRRWQYIALRNRPEMRAALYEKRNTERGATQRLLQSFPSLLLRYGTNFDTNPYLVNNNWLDAGATLSLNLMRLAALPLSHSLGKRERERAEAQTDMLAAAVLSQVVIANKVNLSSQRQQCLGQALVYSSGKHLAAMQVRYQGNALDGLTMMRVRVDDLLLTLENDMAEADARHARLLLAQSVGLGAWPDGMTETGVARIERISRWLQQDMAQTARDELQEAAQALQEEATASAATNGQGVNDAVVPAPAPTPDPKPETLATISARTTTDVVEKPQKTDPVASANPLLDLMAMSEDEKNLCRARAN